MLAMILMGALSALAILLVMFRLGIKRFLRWPALTDVLVSVLLAWVFAGTLGGMIAAITGGLIFSVLLFIIQKVAPVVPKARSWAKTQMEGV